MKLNDVFLEKLARVLLLFLIPAVTFSVWNGNATAIEIKDIIVQIVCLLVMGILGMIVLLKEKVYVQKDILLSLSVGYCALLIFSFLNTNRLSLNYDIVVPPLYATTSFLLFSTFFRKNDVSLILRILVITSAFASLYGIIQFFNLDPVNWANQGEILKVISVFGHKNYFAIFLILMIPLSIYLIIETKGQKRIFYCVCSMVMFFALLLSSSRGAQISFFIAILLGAVLLIIIEKKRSVKRNLITKILIITPILLIIAVLLLPKAGRNYYSQIFKLKQFDLRMSYYKATGELLQNKPFFGVGPGNFVISYPKIRNNKAFSNNPNMVLNHVHNDYLEIWVEYGIFAVFIYLLIISLVIKRGIKYIKSNNDKKNKFLGICLIMSIAGFCLYSLFTVAARYMSSLFYFWLILALCYICFSFDDSKKWVIKNKFYQNKKIIAIITIVWICLISFSLFTNITNYLSKTYITLSSKKVIEKDYKSAIINLDKSLSLNNKNIEAYYQRGYVHFNMERYDQAIKDYATVNRYAPHYVNLAFNMASCYYRKRDWTHAILWAEQSNEDYPTYTPNMVMLAHCFYYNREPQKALVYCEKVLRVNKNNEKMVLLKNKLLNIMIRS